jgi:hypothetical protein
VERPGAEIQKGEEGGGRSGAERTRAVKREAERRRGA